MSEILSRRDAVERIAKRYGYSDERAEDIAQEAALQLIANPRLVSQSAKQAFVDVLRGSSEGSYSRARIPNQPLYESSFEAYASLVDGCVSGRDLEGEQIVRSELSHAVDCFSVLRPKWRRAIELYVEGFSLAEISVEFGCSESRVSQLVKFSRLALKEAVVSKGLSQQEQRQRKWRESQGLSPKIQTRSAMERGLSFAVEAFRCQAIEGMVSFKVPKIPQSLFTTF